MKTKDTLQLVAGVVLGLVLGALVMLLLFELITLL